MTLKKVARPGLRVLDFVRLYVFLPAVGAALASCAPPPSAIGAPADGIAARQWANPLVPQRADPQIFRHSDGYYYMMATVPDYSRLELRRARTIAGLSTAEPRTIWTPTPETIPGRPIWAPELHRINGRWYVYFSAGMPGKPWSDIRIYALENRASDPFAGEWVQKGRISTKWDSFSLDATSFELLGQRYFVWTQVEPDRQGSNIMIARMRDPLTLDTRQTILSRPDHDWEKRGHWVNEGPAIMVRNGRVFLTYSASATDANYCMGLLSAPADADLLDPRAWKKSDTPVMQSDRATSQFGPGHNSFTTMPDGRTDIIVYHARNYEKIVGGALSNPDRATRAQAIRWRDGNPVFGPPVADGPYSIDEGK